MSATVTLPKTAGFCYGVERDELDRLLAGGGYSYREAQNRII